MAVFCFSTNHSLWSRIKSTHYTDQAYLHGEIYNFATVPTVTCVFLNVLLLHRLPRTDVNDVNDVNNVNDVFEFLQ